MSSPAPQTRDAEPPFPSDRELVISRIIDAPRQKLYQAWTQPELLKQWFAPAPWTTPRAETDVRPGGANLIVMRGPDGQEFPHRGVYLEVVENERLVFTDAYTRAWEPSDKPFITVVVTFENENGKTKYTARVRHWSVGDRELHEKMGFYAGWGQCADQLTALVTQSKSHPGQAIPA
ncbi:MAG TPA: SRPBCC family protein [Clostridia bacterium]|nr:SRPBCC family protein [Clostridia bacterium]